MHVRLPSSIHEYGDVFNVFVDGILSARVQLHAAVTQYPILAIGAGRSSPLLLQVIKATEPNWNAGNSSMRAPVIDGFTLWGGDLLPASAAPPTTLNLNPQVYPVLAPPVSSPRKLLFIGDSLTAG